MSKKEILRTAAYRRKMFLAQCFFFKFFQEHYMSFKYLVLPFSFTYNSQTLTHGNQVHTFTPNNRNFNDMMLRNEVLIRCHSPFSIFKNHFDFLACIRALSWNFQSKRNAGASIIGITLINLYIMHINSKISGISKHYKT